MKRALISIFLIAAAASCIPNAEQAVQVIPFPENVETKSGTFNAAGAEFHCSKELDEASSSVIKDFMADLSNASGKESRMDGETGRNGFTFIVDTTLAHEAYALTISRKAVIIKASGLNGFNYAIQTIKQMLPIAIYGQSEATEEKWTLPCAEIIDAPRFGYRGMHLDVARHFFSKEEVMRYLDLMEIHKLNTFHWHLTDDQGWRIEIDSYPELTRVGAIRKGTCIKKDWENLDGQPYGGFYTKDEIREVISYAAAKGITVIPEIDLPGHMLAALSAYPELGCTGGPYEVWCRWGVSDDVLCAGNDNTMTFLKNVLDEIVELFPSEYIHIGGDECPKARWEKCPECQAKIRSLGLKDDDRHKAEHYLQSYIMSEISVYLEAAGKRVIGWDEILDGACPENAIVMSWRGVEGGQQAARLGHDVIMTPSPYLYFDYYQSRDIENEPFGIGGYLPVEKSYSFEPHTEGMSDEEKAHIIGVQANLWTEYIKTQEHLYYMVLPRMAALSEVQWCGKGKKDFDRFSDMMPHMMEIYDIMGYSYAEHMLQARGEVLSGDGSVKVKLSAPGNA